MQKSNIFFLKVLHVLTRENIILPPGVKAEPVELFQICIDYHVLERLLNRNQREYPQIDKNELEECMIELEQAPPVCETQVSDKGIPETQETDKEISETQESDKAISETQESDKAKHPVQLNKTEGQKQIVQPYQTPLPPQTYVNDETCWTKNVLYISNLAPDVTENHLNILFTKYVPVHSIFVIKDSQTLKCTGAAVVCLHTVEHADFAMATLMDEPLLGKPILIAKYYTGGIHFCKPGNLFVRNLPTNITNKMLYLKFSEFGTVVSCRAVHSKRLNTFYGYVQFLESKMAECALKSLNQTDFCSEMISIETFQSSAVRGRKPTNPAKVFMSTFNQNVTVSEIENVFGAFGSILHISIIKANNKSASFIWYKHCASAMNAVEYLNGKQAFGGVLYVSYEKSKQELKYEFIRKKEQLKQLTRYKNLHVKNIPPEFDEDQFIALFSQFGTIVSAKIERNDEGISKEFGYVSFASEEEAKNALYKMNAQLIGQKRLIINFIRFKSERVIQGDGFQTQQVAPQYDASGENPATQLVSDQYAPQVYPAQYTPPQYTPLQYIPPQYAPRQYAPPQYAPAQYAPPQYAPPQYAPPQYAPPQYAPSQFVVPQSIPQSFTTVPSAPIQYTPIQYAPMQMTPVQDNPTSYLAPQFQPAIPSFVTPQFVPQVTLPQNTQSAESSAQVLPQPNQIVTQPVQSTSSRNFGPNKSYIRNTRTRPPFPNTLPPLN